MKLLSVWASVVLCALAIAYSMGAHAATINAASCSQADVQSAIDAASSGDVVAVPFGDCTWTSNLTIGSTAITLQGAGIGLTNITHGVTGTQDHLVQFTEDATVPTRITGFSFLGGGYDHRFVECDGTYSSAPMRIDHNSFYADGTVDPDDGAAVLVEFRSCRGLVDHNTFTAVSNAEDLQNWGPSPEDGSLIGWINDIFPASTNALYVEDNTFANNTVGDWGAQSAMENYDAAIIVARHNTFNDNQVDCHGGSDYGTRWFELYENTFTTTAGYTQDKYFDVRAGTGVIFNNHHTGADSNAEIVLRHETRPGDCSTQSPTGVGCWVGMGVNQNEWSPAYVWGNDSSMTVAAGQDITQGIQFFSSNSQPSPMTIWESGSSATTYNYAPFTYPYPVDANGLPSPSSGGSSCVGCQMSVVYVDSQETSCYNGAAANAIDGNPNSMWVTQFCSNNAPMPHEIRINLGASYNLTGFQYLPRQDGCANGWIKQYEFYVSTDGVTWPSQPTAQGTFDYGNLKTSCPGAGVPAALQVAFPQTTGQYIRLRALSEINGNPWTTMAELNVLGTMSQAGWSVSADSQETGCYNGAAANAIDGNPGSLWVTQFCGNTAPMPHQIQINLGASYNLNGFQYLPRQDGCANGWIKQYEFYVSTDGVTWPSQPTAQGTFDYGSLSTSCPGAGVPTALQIAFPPTTGQYVRLRALSEINGNPWTTMAEFNLLGMLPSTAPPPPPAVAQVTVNPSIIVGGAAVQGTVILSGPAPAAGAVVALSSSGSSATVPSSVTVPANSTSVSFPINTSAVGVAGDVTITATLNGVARTALTMNPGSLISESGWAVVAADSQETSCYNGAAANAIDGTPNTLWVTQFCGNTAPMPHEIEINLGASYSLTGFQYLPRQDGCGNGWIKQYEFYVSADGATWPSQPTASGTFDYGDLQTTCPGAGVPSARQIGFPQTTGQYIRLRVLSGINGNPWTAVAEINVLGLVQGPSTYAISGSLSPAANGAGATVTLGGATSAAVTADQSGNYGFTGLLNGTYSVTPSKSGVSFTPPSLTVTLNGGSAAGVNFTAVLQTWSLSGSLSPAANGAGATVTLGGAASAAVTADPSGNYGFTGLLNGTYSVTPSKSGFTFSPAAQSATISDASVANLNFAVSVVPPPVAVALSPTSGAMLTGGMLQFSASVANTSNTAVTWTASGGTVSDSGLYTAPGAAGRYTVTATSVDDTSKSGSATVTVFAPTSGSVLLGDQNVESQADSSLPLGQAEAFQTVASTNGNVQTLVVYLDSTSTVSQLVAGLYADAGGHPGALLNQGSSTQLVPGAWNTIALPSTSVIAATPYWIAILGTGSGAPALRDATGGACASETSLENSLTALPASWTSGAATAACPASIFGDSSKIIFYDNFAGTTISPYWTVISRHGEYAQDETECNTAQQVAVNNGLTITTIAQSTVCGDFNTDGSVRHAPAAWPFATGDIQWSNFNFTYGTVEIQGRIPPKSVGLWPAFWLLGSNCQVTNPFTADTGYSTCAAYNTSGYTEIDMTECVGGGDWCQFVLPNENAYCSYHIDTNTHVFTLTWNSSGVSVAVDGQSTGCSFPSNSWTIPSTPMFLIIQTQTGGIAGNLSSSSLPASLIVNYVKVTQP